MNLFSAIKTAFQDARYASIRKDIAKAARRRPDDPRVHFKVLGTANLRSALELGCKVEQTLSVAQLEGTNVGITTVLMSAPNPRLDRVDAVR